MIGFPQAEQGCIEVSEKWILIDALGKRRKFLWLTFAPPNGPGKREAISVGFSETTFVVAGVESVLMLDNETHVTEVDLRAERGEAAITNPHFTFHAPAWMHLRANGEQPLLEQLVCMDLLVADAHRVPWLRFASKAVHELPEYTSTRSSSAEQIVVVPRDPTESIAVRLDFVDDPDRIAEQAGELVNQVIEWHGWFLHLAIDAHPGRDSSTFTWLQQH